MLGEIRKINIMYFLSHVTKKDENLDKTSQAGVASLHLGKMFSIISH
jgi:hypothetical protein